jgi:tetratricopeptide (TPR) repeat protein
MAVHFRESSLLVALLLALAGCTSPAEKAAEYGALAAQADMAGDPAAAKALALRAVQERDDVAEYWLLLGRSHLRLSELGAAHSAYLRAAEIDRANVEALGALAQLTLGAGKLKEADQYADQLLLLNPADLNAVLVKGFVALREQRYQESRSAARRVLERMPEQEAALVLEARSVFEQGKPTEAIQILESSIGKSGASRMKLETLLQFYEKARNPEGLARTHLRMVELDPQDVNARAKAARFMFRTRRSREGLQLIEDHLSGPAAVTLALALEGVSKDLLPAEKLLALGERATPGARVLIASVLLDHGHAREASLLTEGYATGELDASRAIGAAVYAAAQYRLGNRAGAKTLAARLLRFDSTNPRGLELRTVIRRDEGDFSGALADARILVRDYPRRLQYRLLLAEIYELKKEPELAQLTLRAASRDFPEARPEALESWLDLRNAGGG